MRSIKLKHLALSTEEVLIESYQNEFVFEKEHLVYKSSGKWRVLEEKLGMEVERYYDNTVVVWREFFRLEIFRTSNTELWCLEVDGIKVGFETKDEAMEVFNKLIWWKNTKHES